VLADVRTGKNGRHLLVRLLRQSVFGRLAATRTWTMPSGCAAPRRCVGWSAVGRRTRRARLREKLIKVGAKVVSHGRYVTFQMAEVAVLRRMFTDILSLIARRRVPPAPA